MNKPEITPILHDLIGITAQPLKSVETGFAIDSSGFRTRCFGFYSQDKYHLRREHKWLKAHICTGIKTNVVTGIEITEENGADSPQFTPLIKATAQNGFNIAEVVADKAYCSRDNYEVVKEVGGQAYIPFKSNATGKSRGSRLWHKMFLYFQFKQEEFMEHYHKRSNVESTFAAIKKKFGDTLKSKNPIAQENELLCKIIAYNITVLIQAIFELGLKLDFCSKSSLPAHKVGKN